MKIALPTANGQLAMHFGHCEKFVIADIENNEIVKQEELVPPPHEPGLLPKWLGDLNVNIILAGGMGTRAQDLFTANNIKVIVGLPADDIDSLIKDYMTDKLISGENVCDH